MQMVINIPEEEYKCVQITGHIGNTTQVSNAILNGTPLQGYGRLIDADAFQDRLTRQRWTFRSVKEYKEMMLRINDEPTIIEADKEVEE